MSAVDPEEESVGVQRKATDSAGAPVAAAAFGTRLQRAVAEGGRPLEPATRSFMESRIGADFAEVRIHTGARSSELAREIKARAFTHQRNVFFGAGEYRPTERSGRRLLAHELAHVVQQNAQREFIVRRKPLANEKLREAIKDRRDVGTGVEAVDVAPEMWRCEITNADVTPDPKVGKFYRLKPGQSLLDVAKRAISQPLSSEQSLALAQVINDHPCNARFHVPGGPPEFHGTVISSAENFANTPEAQGVSLNGGKGTTGPFIWIPDQTFRPVSGDIARPSPTNSTGFEAPRSDGADSAKIKDSCGPLPPSFRKDEADRFSPHDQCGLESGTSSDQACLCRCSSLGFGWCLIFEGAQSVVRGVRPVRGSECA
jgi:hypothetical protein